MKIHFRCPEFHLNCVSWSLSVLLKLSVGPFETKVAFYLTVDKVEFVLDTVHLWSSTCPITNCVNDSVKIIIYVKLRIITLVDERRDGITHQFKHRYVLLTKYRHPRYIIFFCEKELPIHRLQCFNEKYEISKSYGQNVILMFSGIWKNNGFQILRCFKNLLIT